MAERFQVSIRANVDGVAKVNEAFRGFAEARAVPDEVRRSMSAALDELLTNTIWYGATGGETEVTVEGELSADRLMITVSDAGQPFDPFAQAPPDTTLSVDDRPVGGLGIHLVRHLMDDVSYERRSGRNVVVLTKRIAAPTE
jgi:anti-sigma regulatory factor (Ser/Thr protein kinase)